MVNDTAPTSFGDGMTIDEQLRRGGIHVGVGTERGHVVLAFEFAVKFTAMKPEAATGVALDIARQAYEIDSGRPAESGSELLSLLAKRDAIDTVRPGLVTRASLMIRSMQDKGTHHGVIAQHVVDAVLKEVT